MIEEKDFLALKWGTLKRWKLSTPKGVELLNKYHDLGSSLSAMLQEDSQEQKELICQMIEECSADKIYLDWDDEYVTKEEAKKYVLNYGIQRGGQ